jgi:hypothetical protein
VSLLPPSRRCSFCVSHIFYLRVCSSSRAVNRVCNFFLSFSSLYLMLCNPIYRWSQKLIENLA